MSSFPAGENMNTQVVLSSCDRDHKSQVLKFHWCCLYCDSPPGSLNFRLRRGEFLQAV